MKPNLSAIRFAVLACALGAAPTVPAQTAWLWPSGGQWADAANWSAGVPNLNLAVAITNAGNKTVTISASTPEANLAARRLDLYAPAGSTNTLRLEQLGLAIFQLTNSLVLDAGGRMELINSTLRLDGGAGGNFNQFAGALSLTGGTLFTTNGAGLRIGRVGRASADVSSGTLATSGDAVVGGLAGSDGTLVLNSGLFQADGQLTVGDDPGAVGHIQVIGGTFIVTNSALTARVGDDGEGTLAVLGGTVLMDDVSVGRSSGSVGRLLVRGGSMTSRTLSVGRFAGAQGTLEISGGSLDLSAYSLYVGREGAGTLVITNGTLHAATVMLAAVNGANGLLQLRGGTLVTGQFLATNSAGQVQFHAGRLETRSTTVANGAALVVGDGTRSATLHLEGGIHTFANGLVLSSNAVLTGTGTVVGDITVLPGGSNQLGGASPPVTLTPQAGNGPFWFSFPSVTGKRYEVLAATNLLQPHWAWQTTLDGNGATLTYTNTAPGAQRFFRVLAY